MRSDTVRTHFIFGLIVNGDIFQTNILTFMICNYLVKILIRFYLWVCVCSFLHVYTYTLCVHAVPTETRNRHQIPLKLELKGGHESPSVWVLGTEQQVLCLLSHLSILRYLQLLSYVFS